MSEILREQWYHASVFFRDKPERGGKITLLVRRFRLVRGPKTVRIQRHSDAFEFESEEEMVAAIEEHPMLELPDEADGNPTWIPPDFEEARALALA
jgi:hypothetical protein